MSFFKATRYREWWEYKMVPLMSICYATTLQFDIPLSKIGLWLLFLLGSLIVGAVYVSIINDITDIDEDLASGKSNRMASLSPKVRWLVPIICISAGLAFLWFFSDDHLSAFLYFMAWVSFSLYSIPPFRLKTRGGWGVLGDACGSHFFTSLLMVAATSHFLSQPINWLWFSAVGVWALTYGFRGILWHQFHDRDNDLKVGLNTFAAHIEPSSFRVKEKILLAIELTAFIVMLYCINQPMTLVFLLLYFVLITMRYKRNGIKIIIILSPAGKPFQIFMGQYYQLFWPLSLLVAATLLHSSAWIIFAAHILLFPMNLLLVASEMGRFVRGRFS